MIHLLCLVRLFGQGLDIIEVSDDGCGVSTSSRPYLATRYATSKISTFEDIYSGTGLSMGFRGEALFSMACLSQKLVVATRTETDEMAQKLEFQRDGSLDPQSLSSIHRKVGTTVAVVKPFAALPARRADLARRIRAERAKLFRLMESCKFKVLRTSLLKIVMMGNTLTLTVFVWCRCNFQYRGSNKSHRHWHVGARRRGTSN
jgi:DNA mismatch repair ATPase MutL